MLNEKFPALFQCGAAPNTLIYRNITHRFFVRLEWMVLSKD
jgi:hypothetical protein